MKSALVNPKTASSPALSTLSAEDTDGQIYGGDI